MHYLKLFDLENPSSNFKSSVYLELGKIQSVTFLPVTWLSIIMKIEFSYSENFSRNENFKSTRVYSPFAWVQVWSEERPLAVRNWIWKWTNGFEVREHWRMVLGRWNQIFIERWKSSNWQEKVIRIFRDPVGNGIFLYFWNFQNFIYRQKLE